MCQPIEYGQEPITTVSGLFFFFPVPDNQSLGPRASPCQTQGYFFILFSGLFLRPVAELPVAELPVTSS